MNDNPNAMILSRNPKGDHAIVLAAKGEDEQAFGILFKQYQPKIFAIALRYTGIPEDAEDDYASLSIYGNSPSYPLERRLDAWVYPSAQLKHEYSTAEASYERHCGALESLHEALKH